MSLCSFRWMSFVVFVFQIAMALRLFEEDCSCRLRLADESKVEVFERVEFVVGEIESWVVEVLG